jgi:hypothetical protein
MIQVVLELSKAQDNQPIEQFSTGSESCGDSLSVISHSGQALMAVTYDSKQMLY